MLVAIQSRINGELGKRLGDGVPAALISFGSGLVILLVLALVIPRIRASFGNVWRTIRTSTGEQGRSGGGSASGD